MKSLIKYFKTGKGLIPAYLIILYLLFIATDIITTYMASPDLKYEFNRVVRYFNLNFTGIIFLAAVNATVIIIYLFTGRGYLESYLDERNEEGNSFFYKLTHDWRLLLSLVGMTIFYAHLYNSFYVTFNNYLGHIFLNRPDSQLREIANTYIVFTNEFGPLYVRFTQLVTTTFGALFTFYSFKSIEARKRKVFTGYSVTGD